MFAFTTYCISVGHFTPDLVFFFSVRVDGNV